VGSLIEKKIFSSFYKIKNQPFEGWFFIFYNN